MNQGMRFLVRPGTFINQLQWSTHHWLILFLFLTIAAVETHIGPNQGHYQIFAQYFSAKFRIPYEWGMWVVTFLKLSAFLMGSLMITSFLWFVGNLFGRHTSKRVLFRRLTIVFTVLLGGYTLLNWAGASPDLIYVAYALFGWGSLLGYFALREQFALSHMETLVLSLFGFLLISSSWYYSNQLMASHARQLNREMANKSSGYHLRIR